MNSVMPICVKDKDVSFLNRLEAAERYFFGTVYENTVREVYICWDKGDVSGGEVLLNTLPDKRVLLKELLKKLEGKSVYKTLKKIEEGKVEKTSEFLKGLFSLGTHIAIEVEQGNKEYAMLYPVVYEKIGQVLYGG